MFNKMTLLISREECIKLLGEIQLFCEQPVESEYPEIIRNLMLNATAYLSNCTVIIASCKYHLENAKQRAFDELADKISKESPMIAKERINAYCKEESSMLMFAERQSACLNHQIDAYRSVLSYAKAELSQIKING
jgi:hypothetical protein